MRPIWLACFGIAMCATPVACQDAQKEHPQSAREALIEMFMGKGGDDFTKHLSDEGRRVLVRQGDTPETSISLKIAMLGRQAASQAGHIETFETGPNIMVIEDPTTREKIEVGVEHDSLMGEEDEIELSVHAYKDGEPQWLPVVPRLTFTLKQEKEIWRLTEITAAAHIPLTDVDYLKGLRKEQDRSNESAAQSRLMVIAQAQARYADAHKEIGYTCTMDKLLPTSESGVRAYVSPTIAEDEPNAYRFSLSGCDGAPATKYRVLAVPLDPESEMKVLCVDESGTIKSTSADKKSSCFSQGHVEISGPAVIPTIE